ncbi:MAG: murein hydrolase activator EnvC family protein [Thermoleophilia bacterium]
MRKRKWTLILMTMLLFLLMSGSGPAVASGGWWCGFDPPLQAGGLARPVPGPVTRDWQLDCSSGKGHRGVDLAAAAGTAVLAAADGKVIFSGYTPAEGGSMTVSIGHPGGYHTTYLHLSKVLVADGQYVTRGQEIAESAGPYIHFGLKSGSDPAQYSNPFPFLTVPAAGTTAAVLAPEPVTPAASKATPAPPASHAAGPVAAAPAEPVAMPGEMSPATAAQGKPEAEAGRAGSHARQPAPQPAEAASATSLAVPAADGRSWLAPPAGHTASTSAAPVSARAAAGINSGAPPAGRSGPAGRLFAVVLATGLLIGGCLLAGRAQGKNRIRGPATAAHATA